MSGLVPPQLLCIMGSLNQVGIYLLSDLLKQSSATDPEIRGFFRHFHHDLAENKAFIGSKNYYSRCLVIQRRKRRRDSGL